MQFNPVAVKAKLFRGFSDTSRLAILECLRNAPVTVTEIVELTGLGQSNVSNHLSCLKDCGLVKSVQKGRYIYYSYTDERIGNFLQLADSVVADLAKGFYECTRYAEEKNEEACHS
jgi:DNA-binding transcriptional ArsR family regulator